MPLRQIFTRFISIYESALKRHLAVSSLPTSSLSGISRIVILHLFAVMALVPAASAESSIETEIALAAEAAPTQITNEASYLLFEHDSFRTLRSGTNNFTCLVVRNPQGRSEPACFNAEAMRSVFPTYELEMKLLYAGTPIAEVTQRLSEAFNDGLIPAAETGALVYMMSQNNLYFNPATEVLGPTPVHQMFYFPKLSDETFSLNGNPTTRLWQGYPHLTALIVDIAE